MAKNSLKLSYDDITIVPETVSDICSRSECNPYDENGMLPIFASCMSSVVSIDNVRDFNEAKINVVIPRSYPLEKRIEELVRPENLFNFVAFSLAEAHGLFVDGGIERLCSSDKVMRATNFHKLKICIDLANGHMKCLLDIAKAIKDKYYDTVLLMAGNIANPKTYEDYEKAGIDYVRVSVGTGSCCTTSSNTGIHYPVFSLLSEIHEIRKKINGKCKVIADGGVRGYRDIQKALLFADYVMIGGLFNKAIESAGETTYGKTYWNVRGYKILRPITTLLTYGKIVPKECYSKAMEKIKENKLTVWKSHFGQSTKIAQAIVAKANSIELKKLKTSEGLMKYQKVEYDLKGWAENETDYLKSAMSYTNSKTLEEYKESQWVQIMQRQYND